MPDFPALAPGLTDLLEQAFRSQLARIQGGIPARVEKYTQATQVCDALPVTMVYDDDELKTLPVLRSVPVIWPGGGGGALTFPLTIGDFVWLQVGMADFDAWHASASVGQPPATKRSFSLSDVVAHPVISSMAAALPNTAVAADGPVLSGNFVYLVSALATDFMALASKVDKEFAAVQIAHDTHKHATAAVGPPVVPDILLAPGNPNPVGSTKIKAE